MSKLSVKKNDLSVIVLLCILFLCWRTPGLIKYIITLFFSLMVIFFKRNKIEKKHLYILSPGIIYFIFGLIGNIRNGFLNFYSLKQLLLVLVTSVAALGLYYLFKDLKTGTPITRLMFFSVVICNIALVSRFSITNLLESVYAFIYGIFILYFFVVKDYKCMILTIFLCLIAHKRIAEGAFIASLLIMIHLSFQNNKKKVKILLLIYILVFFLFSYYIVYSVKNGKLIDTLRKLNIHSMGRDFIWGLFQSDYKFDFTFLGRGTGFVFSKLDYLNYFGAGNMHNDYLATFIEIGFAGFGFWILSYFYSVNKIYKLNNNSTKTLIFLMGCIFFTMINYITDNLLVYIEYWLPLNIIILDVTDNKTIDRIYGY